MIVPNKFTYLLLLFLHNFLQIFLWFLQKNACHMLMFRFINFGWQNQCIRLITSISKIFTIYLQFNLWQHIIFCNTDSHYYFTKNPSRGRQQLPIELAIKKRALYGKFCNFSTKVWSVSRSWFFGRDGMSHNFGVW